MTTTYSRLKVLLAFVVLFLISTALKAQNSELYINEFKASNTRGIKDDFSEFSDWIELYNSSITELNLDGYFITDNKNDSTKWSFPAYIMPAQSYLTVFASGKDLKSLPITWKTVVNQGDTWRYKIPNANISGWINLEYDDSAWSSGNSGFGYGDSDDNTNIANRTISVYTRKEFTIENLASITRAIFHVDYDDAFIAYINGMEIARANIGTPGTPVNWNASAIVDREARMYSGGLPEEYEIYDISSFLTEGTNVLAVEIHNVSAGSSDMSLIPFLSLGYSSYNGIPYKNEILGLPGSFLHTNFKLDAGGEFIGLYNASGAVIDSLTFFEQVADISYGRAVNDPNQWGFQVVSTPGEKNVPDFLELPEKPQFSISGGFYNGTQTLTITAQSATDKIYSPPMVQIL
ncbi:MAG: lamin tail domain-containing protein [Mariniphaga sp.]|nr:lamin tail domain-containing protein [Mariniphaga sp.]